jgi:hypothetical protein
VAGSTGTSATVTVTAVVADPAELVETTLKLCVPIAPTGGLVKVRTPVVGLTETHDGAAGELAIEKVPGDPPVCEIVWVDTTPGPMSGTVVVADKVGATVWIGMLTVTVVGVPTPFETVKGNE